jgi:hypothetical protein
MKDKSQKRKERERVSHAKVLRRRKAMRAATRDERKKELLDHQTRRRQEPIKKGDLPMTEDKLQRNLDTLKTFENEYVDNEKMKQDFKEKIDAAGSRANAVSRVVSTEDSGKSLY